MNITIKKLSTEIKEDFLYFFDEVAFSDNEKWSRCYCQCYLEDAGEQWILRSGETNRNAAIQRIEAGTMSGFIAFEEDQPVGWCHAGLKKNIKAFAEEPDGNTAVIICFIIAPAHRRKGISKLLLNHILEAFKADGIQTIEAYPAKDSERSDHNYHGFFKMYQNAGFDIIKEEDDCYIVRKQLQN